MAHRPSSTYSVEMLADPRIDSQTLSDIAATRRDLWDAVLRHPNCLPDVAQWIALQQRYAQAASDARANRSRPALRPSAPPRQPNPSPSSASIFSTRTSFSEPSTSLPTVRNVPIGQTPSPGPAEPRTTSGSPARVHPLARVRASPAPSEHPAVSPANAKSLDNAQANTNSLSNPPDAKAGAAKPSITRPPYVHAKPSSVVSAVPAVFVAEQAAPLQPATVPPRPPLPVTKQRKPDRGVVPLSMRNSIAPALAAPATPMPPALHPLANQWAEWFRLAMHREPTASDYAAALTNGQLPSHPDIPPLWPREPQYAEPPAGGDVPLARPQVPSQPTDQTTSEESEQATPPNDVATGQEAKPLTRKSAKARQQPQSDLADVPTATSLDAFASAEHADGDPLRLIGLIAESPPEAVADSPADGDSEEPALDESAEAERIDAELTAAESAVIDDPRADVAPQTRDIEPSVTSEPIQSDASNQGSNAKAAPASKAGASISIPSERRAARIAAEIAATALVSERRAARLAAAHQPPVLEASEIPAPAEQPSSRKAQRDAEKRQQEARPQVGGFGTRWMSKAPLVIAGAALVTILTLMLPFATAGARADNAYVTSDAWICLVACILIVVLGVMSYLQREPWLAFAAGGIGFFVTYVAASLSIATISQVTQTPGVAVGAGAILTLIALGVLLVSSALTVFFILRHPNAS